MSNEGRPLAGVRVLDLTRVLAGPYAGRMLSDLGADVVKVEPPEGDVTRNWGRKVAGESGYYTQWNVGKRNLCVDLRAEGGPELIRALATQADVLLENFRPGVLGQYGLDWATLSGCNPRLVMVSISGFGQTGSAARRPAYASVLHAETGLIARQATKDGTPLADLSFSIADTNAALHGLVGLLAALYQRQHTGRGQHVDIAMFDAMLATDDQVHLALDGVGRGDGVVVNEVWDAVGGPLLLSGDFRWVWQCLRKTHGLDDPTPAGATVADKSLHRHAAVRDFFASFSDRQQLLQALKQAGLAFGEVQTDQQALNGELAKERGLVVDVDDRAGGTRRVIQSPYNFSEADSGADVTGAPRRGEHNRQVLADWLDYDTPRLEALIAAGVLQAGE